VCHDQSENRQHAVLAARRLTGGDPPKRLDLLADLVHLVTTRQFAEEMTGMSSRIAWT
jgi:hypothetical protein